MSTYKEIMEQIKQLQTEAEAIKNSERSEMLRLTRATIAEHGFTAQELGLKDRGSRANRLAAIKYRDTNGNTWAGRGKRPRWLSDALANGASLESFAV